MHEITFISTIHLELGKCNAQELYHIIKKIGPEVVFLEADNRIYSDYDKMLFSSYGVFHKKLEVCAIQKYSLNTSFEYVPVCENELSDAFHKKNKIVCQNREFQLLIEEFYFLAATYGFNFINSSECIKFQDEMRQMESQILNNSELDEIVKADIDAYENPMIRNIYSYCNNNSFNTAIFMCGAAHRKAIIEKTKNYQNNQKVNPTWTIL